MIIFIESHCFKLIRMVRIYREPLISSYLAHLFSLSRLTINKKYLFKNLYKIVDTCPLSNKNYHIDILIHLKIRIFIK